MTLDARSHAEVMKASKRYRADGKREFRRRLRELLAARPKGGSSMAPQVKHTKPLTAGVLWW